MTLEIELKISAEEMYDLLIDNLKRETGKETLHEGLIFKKELTTKMGKKVESEVKVIKLDKNKEYTLKYINYTGENELNYKIESLDEYLIKLIYKEEYTSDSFFKKYNNKIMEMFYSYFLRKKRIKMLNSLENYLIKKREGKVKNND